MKALIIADSPEFDLKLVERLAATSDFVVVTDGAVHKIGSRVTPNVVCGDFDSIDLDSARKGHPTAQFVALPDQSKNDLEKALLFLIERGASEVAIACASGGRFDQAAANLAVIIRYQHLVPILMHQGSMVMTVLSPQGAAARGISFRASKDSEISTIALERAATVTLTNVKWPLSKGVLEPGSMGVSNRGLGGDVHVQAHDGVVLVFFESERITQ